ncbi:MAG: O-antigen ligase family protein, partial [Bacteroidetes bacterium]|nr:O-antigen ligase family protein [Bacteroidota bacterium]
YQAMKRGANPGGMSVVQRIEYWKAAFSIIADNFWTGVGTGDMDTAFKERYAKMNSRLAPEFQHRSHNQFLAIFVAFGIFGLLWFVATLIYPPVFLKKIFEFRFLAFYIIIILSMLVEDTLETQQGVTLYAFFTSFLLFVHKE